MAPELTFTRIISLLIPGFTQLIDRRLPKAIDIILIQAFLIYPIYHQIDTLSVIGLIAFPVLWIYSAVDAISTHNFPIVAKDETVFLYSQIVSLILIFGILLEIAILLTFLFTTLSSQPDQQLAQAFPMNQPDQPIIKNPEKPKIEKIESEYENPVADNSQPDKVATTSDVDLTQVEAEENVSNEFNTETKKENLGYVVVVATFDRRQRAERQKQDLAENSNTEIKEVGEKYLVIITGFDTIDEAREEQKKHLKKFTDCYIATSKNPAVIKLSPD